MFINKMMRYFSKKNQNSGPKNWAVEIKRKRDGFVQQANSVEIIALGSSHGAYAFNPEFSLDAPAYNLCSTSQDLYYSRMILEKSLPIAKKCRHVILFYSVFSTGFDLEKTSEKSRCIAFWFLWDIPTQSKCEFWNQSPKSTSFESLPTDIQPDYRGYDNLQKFFNSIPLNKRVQSHLKHNKRSVDQHDHLKYMIDLGRRRGIDLIIVLSPARSDYREFLATSYGTSSKQIFGSVYSIVQTNPGVHLLDYYDCKFLSDSHFGDYDHLNAGGAEILTKQLLEYVNNLRLQKRVG